MPFFDSFHGLLSERANELRNDQANKLIGRLQCNQDPWRREHAVAPENEYNRVCAIKRANEHNGASKQARLDVGRAADRIGDSVL